MRHLTIPVLALLALTSCAVTAKRPAPPTAQALAQRAEDRLWQSRAPNAPVRPVVAVLPFEVQGFDSLTPDVRRLRSYEQIYFPTRLVDALDDGQWAEGAYLAPSDTPAADLLVRVKILAGGASSMRVSVSAHRPDGVVLWSGERNFESKAAGGASDALDGLWRETANRLSHVWRSQTALDEGEVARRRVSAYADRSLASAPPPEATRIASAAAEVERNQLLKPVTDLAIQGAQSTSEPYLRWQSRTIAAQREIQRRREAAEAARREAEKAKKMAFVQGLAGLLGAMGDAQRGVMKPSFTYTAAMQQTAQEADRIEDAAREQEAAIADVKESIESFRAEASQPIAAVSVDLFDSVYQLTGDADAKLAQLRSIVREKLEQALAAPVVTTPAVAVEASTPSADVALAGHQP